MMDDTILFLRWPQRCSRIRRKWDRAYAASWSETVCPESAVEVLVGTKKDDAFPGEEAGRLRENRRGKRKHENYSRLGSVDDYIRYVKAGADELFCGYVPFSWAEKYGTVMALNRREVLSYNVQIGSYSELEILSEMVRRYQKPVHLIL